MTHTAGGRKTIIRNPYWRLKPNHIDQARCFAAYALREYGTTYDDIAHILGVSAPTAHDLAFWGQRWFEDGRAPD